MKSRLGYISILAMVLFVFACEKEFIPDVETGEPEIVVEGFIEAGDAYKVDNVVAKIEVPLLILHGDKDEAVSQEEGQYVYNLLLHSIFIEIENAGHTFGLSHPHRENVPLPEEMQQVLENSIEFILD